MGLVWRLRMGFEGLGFLSPTTYIPQPEPEALRLCKTFGWVEGLGV